MTTGDFQNYSYYIMYRVGTYEVVFTSQTTRSVNSSYPRKTEAFDISTRRDVTIKKPFDLLTWVLLFAISNIIFVI